MQTKALLQLGLFVDPKNEKRNIRTSDDRIKEIFARHGINTIPVSHLSGKISRLIDTTFVVLKRKKDYDTAIVPLFGTWPSFLWQEIVTILLKALGKKIVLRILGGSIPGKMDQGSKRFHRALKRANVLVAPSGYFFHYLSKKGYSIRIIENVVDLSKYPYLKKEKIRPRIIWMRAFTDVYNPAMAIRVAKRLSEKFNDFQMVMAGKDGPLTEAIKKMAAENNLADKIIFPGYIGMQEKLQFANDYDIYICTNKIDNAPVSLIEFMRLGLPVVSVNVGGIPYMISNEQNGLLVDIDDDKAMFGQICKLVKDQAFAQRLRLNAYNYTQQHDEKNVITKWKNLLTDLEAKQ